MVVAARAGCARVRGLWFHVYRLYSKQTSNSASDQHEESDDERAWNREYEQDHTEREDDG